MADSHPTPGDGSDRPMRTATCLRIAIVWAVAIGVHQSAVPETARSQASAPRVGGQEARHVVQTPSAELTGQSNGKRITVVWFWASWCAPCVSHVQGYNRLVEKYGRLGVDFVAVSPETPENVDSFLGRIPIRGWVLADPESLLITALGIKVYPTTLIVTETDKIVLRETGQALPEGVLATAMNGRPVVVPIPFRTAAATETRPGRPVGSTAADTSGDGIRIRFSLTPEAADGIARSQISVERSNFRATGATLSTLVEQAFGVASWQIEWEVFQSQERFDVQIDVPGDESARWKGLLRSLVTDGLGLTVTKEKRTVTSYALDGNTMRLTRSTVSAGESKILSTSGSLDATRISLEGLAAMLGQVIHAQFGNAIHSTEHYEIHLKWEPDNPESLIQGIEKLGLLVHSRTGVEDRVVVRVAACGS